MPGTKIKSDAAVRVSSRGPAGVWKSSLGEVVSTQSFLFLHAALHAEPAEKRTVVNEGVLFGFSQLLVLLKSLKVAQLGPNFEKLSSTWFYWNARLPKMFKLNQLQFSWATLSDFSNIWTRIKKE